MEDLMEKIVSLAKRRGFVYPGSELYNGLGGTWDYGPLGVEMKNNIKKAWWKAFVQERDDVVGLDSAIVLNSKVWEASGHVSKFADPMVDCKKCKKRYRADHLAQELEKKKLPEKEEDILEEHNLNAHPEVIKDLNERLKGATCPACGGALTEVRQFNLMFKTFVGPVEDSSSVAYLRPETAQGIFINFNNVLDSSRKKIPFGIAQIGKAFRNEVTPGNFLFRSREFEQMEIEFFVKPGTDEKWFEYWRKTCLDWFLEHGIRKEKLRLRDHEKDELSHYAKAATDIEYDYPFGGFGELEGIANRTDFDLIQHSKFSGRDLSYFDEQTKEKFIPYVIEPSLGVDRAMLAFLIDAYQEEQVGENDVRVVLRFHPKVAPIKVAIFPLVKDEKLIKMARDLYRRYQSFWMIAYDEVTSIGRRYRRQDEIGTPYCLTVDFDTLEDNAVTVRDRDSMKQVRVKIEELDSYLMTKIC
ncbi:MAG: glycine--tRNA ligase [Patescibacteria group bacterium]|nr:glycine--tRNA ligase [Patescibacteria group bacterium]